MLLAAKTAIAFLTILPVRLPAELPADGLKRSAAFFSLAGWLIGGLLGGGQTQERRLAIMKDSAIGAFGVIGLVLLLVLKIACLASLLINGGELFFFVLLAAPVTARWAMAALACGGPYPRGGGTGHAFVGKGGFRGLALGL